MKVSLASLLATCAFALTLVTPSTAQTILIGGDTLNGNFNSPAVTGAADFATVPSWSNIGAGGSTLTATLDTNTYDGSRNAVMSTDDREWGSATSYTIQEGDVFSISYVWRDAASWDTDDQLAVTLFWTDDNLITGTRTTVGGTNYVSLSGGKALNTTYVSFADPDAYTAIAADAGRALFVSIAGVNGSGTVDFPEFARMDNFQLTVVPEPSSLALLAGAIGLLAVRRNRQR